MTLRTADLQAVMEQAVARCVTHVESGGLPFVGVLVDDTGVISDFGVNRVHETGDPSAHAEIVAMRDAMRTRGLATLNGTSLLATGEPCGLCYRFAIRHGVKTVYVAVDRDEVAAFGFDYRGSYRALGITDDARTGLYRSMPVRLGTEPFIHYLHLHQQPGHAPAGPETEPKGTSS